MVAVLLSGTMKGVINPFGTERRALKEALRRDTSEYVSPQMAGLRKIDSTEVNMALGD